MDRWIRFFTHFLVPLAFICSFPWFFPYDYAIQLGQIFAITYIIIVGLNILVGLTNHYSLGHGGFVAIGAYGATLLSQKVGLSFLSGILVGAFIAGLIALLFPLLFARKNGMLFSLGTLVFGLFISLLLANWSGYPVAMPQVLGITMDSKVYFLFVAILALTISYATGNLLKGRFGRTLIAIGNHEKGAKRLGVNIRLWKMVTFFFSGFFAGLGGSLLAYQEGWIQSTSFNLNLSLLLLLGVIIGGAGSKWGPAFGTGFLVLYTQFIPNQSPFHVLITLGMLLLTLVIMPGGLVGFFSQLKFIKNLKRVRGGIIHYPAHPHVEFPVSEKNSFCIYEEPRLFKELTVIEHILLGFHQRFKTGFLANLLDLQRVEKEEQYFLGRAYDILRFIGLEKKAFEKIDRLSPGQQHNLKIGMALTLKPKSILQGESYAGISGEELVLFYDPHSQRVKEYTSMDNYIENRKVN